MKKYIPLTLLFAGIFLLGKITAVAGHGIVNGIEGMKATKFLPPYNTEGRTTFTNTQHKAGVYLIKENGVVVYIGYSSTNLYRTMYRHFQQWKHPYQEVTTYANRMSANQYTVRVILTTAAQAPKLEGNLIQRYQPRDNDLKLKAYAENTDKGKAEYFKMKQAESFEPSPF